MSLPVPPRALLFDVFGTLVDWRAGIIREARAAGLRCGIGAVDWAAFADAWRARYQPQLETVRSGGRPWTTLDVLHREALADVLGEFGLAMPDAECARLTGAWHRLDPWPDVPAGLRRLRVRFVIAPNSNGHIALQIALARHGGLCWDAILGAEIAQAYKPDPAVYRACVAALACAPGEVMMVAAHNADLEAAARCGLRTAFVARHTEHGPAQTTDLCAGDAVELAVADLGQLARVLGA